MKSHVYIFLVIILFSCTDIKEKQLQELEARIARIENRIQPVLQIEGEETPTYSIEERLRELGIPGLSIAVVANGEIDWAKGYGLADINEKRPVDTSTMFLAGSISKPVAALRTHQLVEKGTFHLDSNINGYLRSWQVPDNEFTTTEKVTLRRILNHTAGLTVWGFPGYDKGDTIPTTVDVLDGKGNTDPVRVYKEPGESWMYSGGGYTVMQLAITDTEGNSFPSTLQKHVLDPLGMQQSTFENPLPDQYHAMAATGYRTDGSVVEGKWPIYPEMAAAGLWTTPSQLVRYAIHIQKIYQSGEDGILSFNSVEEMLTPHMNGHGLGPGISEHRFGHGGADEGFRAVLTAWKIKPYAAVIMVNSDNGKIMQEVLLSVAREYSLPGVEPNIKKVLEMQEEELMRYTGKYEVTDLGVLEMYIAEDGHLTVKGDFIEEEFFLLPESDTLFFDRNDGTQIDFDLRNGSVTGFRVWQYQARKLDQ